MQNGAIYAETLALIKKNCEYCILVAMQCRFICIDIVVCD